MVASNGLWLMTGQPDTAQVVTETINGHGPVGPTHWCRDLIDLALELERLPTPIVVVDLDPAPDQALAELEPLIVRFPHTRFIVTSEAFTTDMMVKAMNVGARHFIDRDKLRLELPTILARLVGQNTTYRQGTAVTILSAGGGCGATTLAVNLAHELAEHSREPSLIVDLDNGYGAVSDYLGLEGQYGLADVLARTDQVDPNVISSTALTFSDQIHALINPVSVSYAKAAPLQYDRLDTAIKSCRQAYRWVIIDAPRVSAGVATSLARQSRLTYITSQLTVKEIRAARSIRTALLDAGMAPDAVRHVVSRFRTRRQSPTLDEAQRAWGECDVHVIHNDFQAVIEAINLGQPLSRCAPRSTPCREIQQLAKMIAQPVHQGNGHAGVH